MHSKTWLNGAIAHGSDLNVGHGNGPADHSYRLVEYSSNCNTIASSRALPGLECID
ncbi:hypothetical protein [Corynebacterium diphtheriae]|uniref:hypothetical protein n=1 Tax=Corynebacterium diphtheriae TaxID=1717 RepID=UPI000A756FC2|nr:hypothetical protein [Corynebacterium diphtheriae]